MMTHIARSHAARRLAPTFLRPAGAVLGALLALGCAGAEVTGTLGAPESPGHGTPGVGAGGGTGGGVGYTQLHGLWSHTRYIRDQAGALHASETRWEFANGGFVERTVVATNVTYGYSDSHSRTGRWFLEGDEIVVVWDEPATGRSRMRWRIESAGFEPVLYLNDTRFVRLS